MKCPKCEQEIGECKICPYCNFDLKQEDSIKEVLLNCKKTYTTNNSIEDDEDKSNFLFIFKIIVLIGLSILAVFLLVEGQYLVGCYVFASLVVIYMVIKTFETIIELLQSINNNIKRL